jgi:hypothetical protein
MPHHPTIRVGVEPRVRRRISLFRASCVATLALLIAACDRGATPESAAEKTGRPAGAATTPPADKAQAPPQRPSTPAEPAPIRERIVETERVEDLSEAAANRLIEFSDAVRRRRPDEAARYLVDDFMGTPWSSLKEAAPVRFPHDVVRKTSAAPDVAPAVDREAFLGELFSMLAPLDGVDFVFFKTRGAEFEKDASRGTVVLTVNIIGRAAGDRPWALYADGWLLSRCVLEKMQIDEAAAPPFVDVADPAGVDVVGARLGTKGNENFYWRGAAVADVDRDGRYDVFSSTHERNYLWRNKGDGTFEDATARFGLDKIAPRVTSPLFFDHDGDGDLDLFCARVGWEEDGVPMGDGLGFYRNDGDSGFVDVTKQVGLDKRRIVGFTAAAADVNGDGLLDVYVCAYNRLDVVYPNSWFAATNGGANALFMGRKDGTFVDRAAEAGVAGTDWSYAAAFADYDEDGDEDLYVANDYGVKRLYRNKGDGTFEDVAPALGITDVGNGMGCAWGDLDDDGRLDVYASNMSSSAGNRILKRLAKKDGSQVEGVLYKLAAGNTIELQKEPGKFKTLEASAGGIGASWAWGPALLDFDLDGNLDVYVSNGFISGNSLKDT